MNKLRENYKTFEEGFKDYLASWIAREKDFGYCATPSEEDKERLKERFKTLWEAEDCPMKEAIFQDY